MKNNNETIKECLYLFEKEGEISDESKIANFEEFQHQALI